MNYRLLAMLLTSILLLAACGTGSNLKEADKTEKTAQNEKLDASDFPQLTTDVQENETLVEIETSQGTIKIKLFPEYAPKAVENFVTHSKNGYYNGLIFHRVIKDFMIQGGDPKGNGTGGESIYGKPFEDEFSNQLYNLRGALSMANSGENTNGSQFFIVQNSTLDPKMQGDLEDAEYPKEIIEAYKKGGTPWLDFHHTVFGQVIEGMDIVDNIANTKAGANDKPVEDVVIKNINVVE
jgi:peptidyl-prolyl cis-trans isomerase B (cyclophilin B)